MYTYILQAAMAEQECEQSPLNLVEMKINSGGERKDEVHDFMNYDTMTNKTGALLSGTHFKARYGLVFQGCVHQLLQWWLVTARYGTLYSQCTKHSTAWY